MQYHTITKTGTGRSTLIVLDDFQTPFSVGLAAVLSGTATFSIEYSLDDPTAAGYVAANATWFAVTGLSAVSATTAAAFNTPCRAISINISSGAGTVTLTAVQAGPA